MQTLLIARDVVFDRKRGEKSNRREVEPSLKKHRDFFHRQEHITQDTYVT